MEKVSVILVNYKGWKDLEHCLNALSKIDSKKIIWEIIIVDNCSNDGQFEVFKNKFPQFKFVLNSSNNGFAHGCNYGVFHATSNYFLFLNPDTVVEQKNLENYIQSYLASDEIALLSCLQIDEKGHFYNQHKLFPTFLTFFGIHRAIYKTLFKKQIKNKISQSELFLYPEWVTGAVILISRYWFEKVKGWDEDYWMYMEDVDLCKRISANNGKIAVLKSATIFHKHGGASRINIRTKALTKTEVIISKHVYISKHFSTIIAFLLHARLFLGTVLEKIMLTILTIPLFFSRKLKVNPMILSFYMKYIWHVCVNKTFISPRSFSFHKIESQ